MWDVLAYRDDGLVAAMELKSILSSYGNNTNNRIEEALGAGIDAFYANKNGLYSKDGSNPYPPVFAYVMIIGNDEYSKASPKTSSLDARVKPDPCFDNTSYIEKHAIALKRMIQDKIYDAAWLVAIDEKGNISEPDKALDFEKFWETISHKIKIRLM